MTHFVYQHLPASGLGTRDPRRPYVTGGIGAGVLVVIPPFWTRDRVGYSPSPVASTPTVVHTARPVAHTAAPIASTLSPVAYSPAPVQTLPAPVLASPDGIPGDDDPVEYSPDEVPHTRLVSDGPTWSP